MKISDNIKLDDLFQLYKNNEISQRSFISIIKNRDYLQKDLIKKTIFLNNFNVDILERLYYIINNLNSVIVCPYCGKKLNFTGRLNKPYKLTCGSKECISKELSNKHSKQGELSNNRVKKFLDWQKTIKSSNDLNDDIIKKYIKYDKFILLIDNNYIIEYLNNRYDDSDNKVETLKRIKLHIEKKPVCPICNKSVVFIGRKNKMFSTYCSNECAGKSKETIKKKKQTQLINWGTENCYDSEKYKALNKEKYGVEYITQIPDVIRKKKLTFLKKYGVEFVSQNKEIQEKIWETCKKNQTFNSSKEEDEIYNYLIFLGYKVERHIKTKQYPFNVDYYLSDYDVYIEYQGSQFHFGRAFLNNNDDKKALLELKEKANKKHLLSNKLSQYDSIIDTWTKSDPKKRYWSVIHNINLLEIFYYEKLEDIKKQLNLYLNILTNNYKIDFNEKKLYSEFEYYKNVKINKKLPSYISNYNYIIKCFQFNNFYKNELNIYAYNPILRRKVIQNRIKYLNKKENELTINDILSGFKISGVFYGYSHFNPKIVKWFIEEYKVKTIYDPCGGWGHHLLGMLNCEYIIYNDLSESTYKGVCNIKDYFHIDNLECHNEDGSKYIPKNVDAFFMCPPYYNLEKYECKEFNNLNEYENFLNKIIDIWNKNSAFIFGIVLREDFIKLIHIKYNEKFKLKSISSNLTKNKKYNEYLYIYKK